MSDESKLTKCFLIPQRVIMAIMGFLAIVNAYTMRLTLSLVITKLVTVVNQENKTSSEYICEREVNEEELKYEGEYEWSQKLQSYVLGSFYIGYMITHIPGGILADHYGGKWVLSLGILSTALFTIATPYVTHLWRAYGLITLRFLMGVGEGTTFPALSVLISHWVPLSERGKIGAFILGGGQVGTILNNSLSGILLHHFYWSFVFYFFGIIALVWFIIFTLICYSTPASHPFISEREKEYLAANLKHIDRKDMPPTPWKGMVTSVPMYALISAQIGHDWGFYIMVTYLPKYFNDVLGISIRSNGFYTSLPFVSMWICSILSGFVGDYLITHEKLTITNTRKMMTFFAAVVPAIFIVCASYAGCNKLLVIMFFTFCLATMGPWYCGMKLSPFDMSPNFAGTIMGISNGIGAIFGFIVPATVGAMTTNATMLEWRWVFWLAFVILNISGIIFLIWGSGEVQPWNEPIKKE